MFLKSMGIFYSSNDIFMCFSIAITLVSVIVIREVLPLSLSFGCLANNCFSFIICIIIILFPFLHPVGGSVVGAGGGVLASYLFI